MRPKALDLFCGAGGASMGLHRAGFDVVGIDIKPQPRYPFPFIQADALKPPVRLSDFDLVWASPPCQAHTALSKMWNARSHADRIPETRALLESSGVAYVMENVPGAPLKASLRLCGTMFNLRTPCGAELRRHRYFETSFLVMQPECRHGRRTVGIYGEGCRDSTSDSRPAKRWAEVESGNASNRSEGLYVNLSPELRESPPPVIGVYGHSYNKIDKRRTITVTGHTPQKNVERNKVRNTYTVDDARHAMGMPWATIAGLSQAIPPAYAEHIGTYAMMALGRP